MMPRGLELDFCQREGDFLFRSGIISSTAYAMIWFRTTEIFRKLAHRCKIVNSYGEDRSTEGIALLKICSYAHKQSRRDGLLWNLNNNK